MDGQQLIELENIEKNLFRYDIDEFKKKICYKNVCVFIRVIS